MSAAEPPPIAYAQDLAERLLAEHGTYAAALPAMLAAADDDLALQGAVLTVLVRAECARILRVAHCRGRGSAAPAAKRAAPKGVAPDVAGWAGAVAQGLMETFEVFPGVKLGAANREQLVAAAASFEMRAADSRVKAEWLRLIAQGLEGVQRVADRYTEARIAELKDEATSSRGGVG